MSTAKYFPDNPNPKVATFEIDEDLMGPYSKIVIPKAGVLRDHQYSPLAASLFPRSVDISRIDFAAKDGKTYIAISRHLLPWSDEDLGKVQDHLDDFLAKSEPVLYLNALQQSFQAEKPFIPSDPVQSLVQQTFHDQVNPVLAEDGGAMELISVDVENDGTISANVALIGSCNGCDHATTSTLDGATRKIREVLDAAKEKYADNPNIQKLSFDTIHIHEAPEVIVAKPQP